MAAIPITNINLASGDAIVTALSNLKGTYNAGKSWQNVSNNRYIVNTRIQTKNDIASGSINHNEIKNYISTSLLIHCFNGWSYLSSAVNALLDGDYGNAIHNAYYAELRGIMSFLSSNGIGVFDGGNILIDIHGNAHPAVPANQPTHVFAKNAFDTWLNAPGNAENILKSFTVENKTLKDWLDATSFATEMASYQASDWLKDWSVDLSIIDTEQKLRNFVSYNPQNFDLSHVYRADNVKDRVTFVTELWKLCGPSQLFGSTILRQTLETVYKNLFGYTMHDLDVDKDLKPILIALGKNPDDANSQSIINFLKRNTSSIDNIVFDYAKNITYSDPILESQVDPMGIISRASLILLTTTKRVETVLRQSGTSKADLQFWFDSIGIKSGYWNSSAEPYLMSDLWSDVEYELNDIERWISDTTTVFTPYNFKNNFPSPMPNIKGFGKACLWNIGL